MNRLGLASLLWLLLLLPAEAAAQKYRYPISSGGTYVTAYFSHSGKDYTCAGYTYSGHTGNDYGVGSWAGMNAGKDVVAAAAGEVVYTQDGYFDRCTTGKCAGALGNYVQLKHADGKYTYYGHLKKWSIKVKKGDKVTCGQKLGQAGSSGYSTDLAAAAWSPALTSSVASWIMAWTLRGWARSAWSIRALDDDQLRACTMDMEPARPASSTTSAMRRGLTVTARMPRATSR